MEKPQQVDVELTDKAQPRWNAEYDKAAADEGWGIWSCDSSENGPLQIQKFDNPDDHKRPDGTSPEELKSDSDAWAIVAKGTLPHHIAAREFLRINNPAEYKIAIGGA